MFADVPYPDGNGPKNVTRLYPVLSDGKCPVVKSDKTGYIPILNHIEPLLNHWTIDGNPYWTIPTSAHFAGWTVPRIAAELIVVGIS